MVVGGAYGSEMCESEVQLSVPPIKRRAAFLAPAVAGFLKLNVGGQEACGLLLLALSQMFKGIHA